MGVRGIARETVYQGHEGPNRGVGRAAEEGVWSRSGMRVQVEQAEGPHRLSRPWRTAIRQIVPGNFDEICDARRSRLGGGEKGAHTCSGSANLVNKNVSEQLQGQGGVEGALLATRCDYPSLAEGKPNVPGKLVRVVGSIVRHPVLEFLPCNQTVDNELLRLDVPRNLEVRERGSEEKREKVGGGCLSAVTSSNLSRRAEMEGLYTRGSLLSPARFSRKPHYQNGFDFEDPADDLDRSRSSRRQSLAFRSCSSLR